MFWHQLHQTFDKFYTSGPVRAHTPPPEKLWRISGVLCMYTSSLSLPQQNSIKELKKYDEENSITHDAVDDLCLFLDQSQRRTALVLQVAILRQRGYAGSHVWMEEISREKNIYINSSLAQATLFVIAVGLHHWYWVCRTSFSTLTQLVFAQTWVPHVWSGFWIITFCVCFRHCFRNLDKPLKWFVIDRVTLHRAIPVLMIIQRALHNRNIHPFI